MSIGIGITTYKRPDMLKKCTAQLREHSPFDVKTIVHDDTASGHGVARSKNACIKYLMSCPDVEHVFLFDDDTWPTNDEWWKPYVESGKEHLSYNWFPEWDDRRDCWPVEGHDDLVGWNTSNGCMLYYTRHALETAGGMRTQFGKWGFEHLEHSMRIHKFGLTPEPFISLAHQSGIYASDEYDEDFKQTSSTITPAERREWYARNFDVYRYYIEKEPEFVAYS